MTLIKLSVKRVSCAAFLWALFFLIAAPAALSQSRNEADPTTIETFPVSGDLPSGTYYYQFRTNSGPATAVLDVTTPDGGASVSASFSGPDCCSADAYVSVESGRAERLRNSSNAFTVERRQKLLITLNVSVAKGRTVPFRLNFSNPDSGSGIIVTPPTPTPTPRPPLTPESGICTDLSLLSGFEIREVGSTKYIKGNIMNLSDTAYSGTARGQGLQVTVFRVGEAPRILPIMRFTEVSARGFIPYSVRDTSSGRRPPAYEARIIYSSQNATDRLKKNDDCNPANDYSRGRPDDVLLP